MPQQNQKTIKDTIKLFGVGLHNGINANLTIKPAVENFGIKFCRVDIDKENLIEANYQNVVEPILCTKIKNSSGTTVSTVEHLMAAFFGEGIDNALVEIDAAEVPILDGSASEFVEAIRNVGTKEQKKLRKFIKVLKKVEIQEGVKSISIEPLANDLIVDFEIVYSNPLIRTRRKEFKLSDGDLTNIYTSRTFCLYEDIDFIKSQGLAKGGSLENAIVIRGNEILNDDGLRNRHEFVYHKILDCLGDLMLSGYRIFGHVKTSQGGHALTNKLLIKFFSDKSNWSLENVNSSEENNQITESSKKSVSASI
ncbi:MAG: UDP-3-O-[3-hydroxymyristoyl] N-acetylglucosamine deacetylase [Candidatus Pelagibacter sp. TMED128]|nr:MAG: UDP-3-O-[3-hydroxymyristoyl] N-acetylglucosamine deacetylase [Candidatus Pelagibacter sp. TMED128]